MTQAIWEIPNICIPTYLVNVHLHVRRTHCLGLYNLPWDGNVFGVTAAGVLYNIHHFGFHYKNQQNLVFHQFS